MFPAGSKILHKSGKSGTSKLSKILKWHRWANYQVLHEYRLLHMLYLMGCVAMGFLSRHMKI